MADIPKATITCGLCFLLIGSPDDDVIHRLPVGDEIVRAVAAVAVATALIVAHRPANRRFLALSNYSARHDVAAQLYAGTL